MANNDSFKQLKSLFEGKIVVAVEPPNAAEAIAKFVMSDGSAFRLHATDLGYWIEPTLADKSDTYKSLAMLFTDYYQLECSGSSGQAWDVEPMILINKDIVRLMAPNNGNEYIINRSDMTEWENRVADHPKAMELFSFAASMGDCWRMAFKTNYGCPEELALADV